MFADHASWNDYCREHAEDPTIECSTECQVCSGIGQRECDSCGGVFCEDHIAIVRNGPMILEQICEECQEQHMSDARVLLLDADDHQKMNPFDPRYADAISRVFADGIQYGVWTWIVAPKEAA